MEIQSWGGSPMSILSPKLPSSHSHKTNSSEETSFSSVETNASSQTTPSLHSHTTPNPSISYLCITSLKITTPHMISCLAVHNNFLYAASINQINVFDQTSYAVIDTFQSNDSASGLVKSIAFGKGKIFTAHQDCRIRVWELTASKRHRLVSTLPTVRDRLYRSISPNNYIRVRRHKKQLWIKHADTVSGLAIIKGLMYSVSWDKCFKIWRMSDLRCLESIKAHADAVNAVVASLDGTVYTASADGKIKVWGRSAKGNDGKHELVTTLEKHKSTVNALALSNDGSVLFSGGCDRWILVWEREEGADHMSVTFSLSGHTGAVLCFIYVDNLLISGSSDRTVRIWGRGSDCGYCCLAVLEGHVAPVKSLVAVGGASNGLVSLFSGSLDGVIKVWQLNTSSQDAKHRDRQQHRKD